MKCVNTNSKADHENFISHVSLAHHLCHVNSFGTRMINNWNNLTSDIIENSFLNSFKLAVDNYFYDFRFTV